MTLKGNLKDFSFIQLLHLINLAKKSGALYVERAGESSRAVFRDGKLAYFETSVEKYGLLKILAGKKLITNRQQTLLNTNLKDRTDREAGIYLENAGYTTLDQVQDVLKGDAAEKFKELFNWTEGSFRFESGELTPEEKIPVQMELENLIVEGSRQVHEIEELMAEIPSLEMALKFAERPGTDLRNISLDATEWKVITFINPKNTIQQIAQATHLDEIEIRRVVYTLLQAGLVELIRPGGVPVPLPGQIVPIKNKEEHRSIVKRLIERIRSI